MARFIEIPGIGALNINHVVHVTPLYEDISHGNYYNIRTICGKLIEVQENKIPRELFLEFLSNVAYYG